MNDYGLDKYFEFFFSIYNPVFLALILFLLLFLVVFISYLYIYQPLLLRHRKEKEGLELKSAKLLALFSELDPNPILRINASGDIIGMNKSAQEIFQLNPVSKNKIIKIFNLSPSLLQGEGRGEVTFSQQDEKGNEVKGLSDINLKELISNNKSTLITRIIDGKFYEINIHGISLLDAAQLYFYDLTEKKKQEEQMNTYQKLLKESSAQSTKVLEEERGKIAALLHDSVGQNLLLLRLGLQNLKKLSGNGDATQEFSNTFSLLDNTLTEIKEIARSIRPLNLDELGLNTVLTSICKNVSRESGISAHIRLPEEIIKLPKDMEVCIYRVTQEALNNIIKHSRAKNFTVNLNADEDSITLEISDDGIGFKPTMLFNDKYISDGMGILNMQERVERLNGTFNIDSSINQGSLILAHFPLTESTDEKEFNYKSTGR